MNYDLRTLARTYAAPPNHAIKACADNLREEVRQIICDGVDCLAYQVTVRLFGSIFNNTHVPGSDADIAVIPVGCLGGPTRHDSKDVCDVLHFREVLFKHLQRRFGSRFVCRQHKAILLCGTDQRMQADIVALLPRIWCNYCPQCKQSHCNHGYEIRSYCEPEREISTWPEQHQRNAADFDLKTGGRFTQSIRTVKGLLKSGLPGFSDVAVCMPPVLLENLFAQVPIVCYQHSGSCPLDILRHIVMKVKEGLDKGTFWRVRELSGMRALFDGSQTWDLQRVRQDIDRLRWLIH